MSDVSARSLPPATSVLVASAGTQAAASIGFWSFTLLIPALAAETGLAPRDFSMIMVFLFLGAFCSSGSSGSLVRTFGGARAIAALLAAMSAALWLNLIGTWTAVMASGFAYGLAYGPQGAIGMSAVTQSAAADRRGLYLALRHSAVPLAAAIGGRLLPPLIALVGWRISVIGVSGAIALAALAAWLAGPVLNVAEGARQVGPDDTRKGWRDRFSIPVALRRLWWAGQGFAIAQIGISVFSYIYLLEVVGISAIAAGVFASNLHVTALLGRPLLGWLCDRTGRAILVLAGVALSGVLAVGGLLLIEAGSSAFALGLLAVLCGIASQCWNPLFVVAMSYRTDPARLSEMNGRAFAFLSLGWALTAPAIWGMIEWSGGYTLSFAVLIGVSLVTAGALLWPERSVPR